MIKRKKGLEERRKRKEKRRKVEKEERRKKWTKEEETYYGLQLSEAYYKLMEDFKTHFQF